MGNVALEAVDQVLVITITRPEVRNAVDGPTAAALSAAIDTLENRADLRVGILTGAEGNFCSGADLKAIAIDPERANRLSPDGEGPMGPTRRVPAKPVIAAIEGHAVAGGLELALWCDLRVAAHDAVLGFFERRWGVPLIDGGTVRLPRLIGQSRALDLILTGRAVSGEEALSMGLVNRTTEPGQALAAAIELAHDLARFPQLCMRTDRASVYEQWGLDTRAAMAREFASGIEVVASGETVAGATRFADGRGRHADFTDM